MLRLDRGWSFIRISAPWWPAVAGDYNDNGVVDAADYVVWRNAGAAATLPNDPTPGTVDAYGLRHLESEFRQDAIGQWFTHRRLCSGTDRQSCWVSSPRWP